VHAHHQAALTAGGDGHVSPDQKGQATEHPLLGHVGLAGDQLADAIGEVFVVGHGGNMVHQGQAWRKKRASPLMPRSRLLGTRSSSEGHARTDDHLARRDDCGLTVARVLRRGCWKQSCIVLR